MEIHRKPNGDYYGTCDMIEDYDNGKKRREMKRKSKLVIKHIKRLNNTSAKGRVLKVIYTIVSPGAPLPYLDDKGHPILECVCGETAKLICWGHYKRKVRYYFSKKKRTIGIQRIRCKRCGKTMSFLPRHLTRYRRFSDKSLRDLIDAKLWFYAGYRKVGKWSRVGGCSHTHIMKEIRDLRPVCQATVKNITLSRCCRFSGIICIDKVYVRKVKGIHYVGIVAIDARYGWVILENTYYPQTPKATKRFGVLKGENIVAKITDVVNQFLDDLLKVIDPKAIITDNKKWFAEAIDRVNKTRKKEERIKHFLCTLHVQWAIDDAIKKGYGRLKLSKELRELRQQFMDVFEADTLEEAERLLDAVLKRRHEFPRKSLQTAFTMLEENKDRLFPYLRYGLNRTNNPAEFYFSFLKRFQHVSHKFSSLDGVRALLSVFALYYNFMKKMEGPNKDISPYMKAGWHIRKDVWSYIDYPKCLARGY
ncbi:MAG: DUF6431 domain-containing protein [Thermoplasmata archaeon]